MLRTLLLITAVSIGFSSLCRGETLDPIVVGVATASAVKINAVKRAFEDSFPGREIHITPYKVGSGIAEQPVTEVWGVTGARNRLEAAKTLEKTAPLKAQKKIDYWVSMENYIEPSSTDASRWIDRAAIIIEAVATGTEILEYSDSVYLSETFAAEAKAKSATADPSGFAVTSGQVIRDHYLKLGIDLPSDDWHRHPDFGGVSRSEILKNAIARASRKAVCEGSLKR